MPNAVEPTLIEPLFRTLQKERYVIVCTIDHEKGAPNVSAVSWVYAPAPDKVYFAVDQRSRIVANVKANPAISIVLIANESTYSISGKAHVKVEKLENVPLKLAAVQVDIEAVRDVMFYGAKISVEPKYDKTYDAQAAAKLDQQVMSALKQA